MQDKNLSFQLTRNTYLQRLSFIWSSLLLDANHIKATNLFALPALTYPMWTQRWVLEDLREVDREARKIISMNGGKHPLSSNAVLYLPRADVWLNTS